MQKNWMIRIPALLLFLGLSAIVMMSIYNLSSENGSASNIRSEMVTEKIKEEVNTRLNAKGLQLFERVKYFVIMHSPYGSNWNANIRKLAHFSIYFVLGSMIYISFAILGMKKMLRFLITIGLCFIFACSDEYHQGYTEGRAMSKQDVLIDTTGAITASTLLTMMSWVLCGIRYGVNKVYE